MKVTALETLHCDAGWRNFSFVKVTTDEGLVGYSEYQEGFGSPGVTVVIGYGGLLPGGRPAHHSIRGHSERGLTATISPHWCIVRNLCIAAGALFSMVQDSRWFTSPRCASQQSVLQKARPVRLRLQVETLQTQ